MSFVCKLCPTDKRDYLSIATRTLVLLSILSMGFLVKIYIDWGMWSARTFRAYEDCTEKYINFEPCEHNHCSVYNDIDLHNKCHISREIEAEQAAIYGRFAGRHRAFISTKCSYVIPRLLSHVAGSGAGGDAGDEGPPYRVPHIVHYVSFNSYEWLFLNYISVRSAHQYIRPLAIFIHGDILPHGRWWNRTLRDVPNVYHVFRERPRRVQGRLVQWLEHSSDITRILTVYANGGIYLDTDVIALRSFDPLRTHPSTLGRESRYGLGSGIIVAEPLSKFLCIWLHAYRNYNPWPWHWAAYAVWTPHHLAKQLASDIHIEEDTFHRPSWQETEQIYKMSIDWSAKYALHVWHRYGDVPTHPAGPGGIERLNNTLGEIMRYVYYGDKSLR